MSYNFCSHHKVLFPEQVSRKIHLLLLWFSVLQKTELLYFAIISCDTNPFELKLCEHFNDEIWNNFCIQLRS